jgi:hypothetical protein
LFQRGAALQVKRLGEAAPSIAGSRHCDRRPAGQAHTTLAEIPRKRPKRMNSHPLRMRCEVHHHELTEDCNEMAMLCNDDWRFAE